MQVALLLLGCGVWPLLDAEPEAGPIPPPVVDGVTFSVPVLRAPAPAPPLWDEPLPRSPEVPDPELAAVVDGICLGLPGAREAADDVVGHPSWGVLLARCADPGFCRWSAGKVALPEGSACEPEPAPPVEDPLANLAERLLDPAGPVDPIALLERHPRHRVAIQDSLMHCVLDALGSEPEGYVGGRRCLGALASVSWNLARGALEDKPAETLPYAWQTAAASLSRWDSAEDMRDELAQIGLIEAGAPIPAGTLTPAELLVASGQGVALGDLLGPGVQGRLLRRLLVLADLPDARAVVREPIDPQRGYLTQHVWLGGLRWRALARHLAPWPDVEQASGLVNALLLHEEADQRLVIADAEADTLVLAVSPAAIEPLYQAAVLRPWVPLPEDP